MYTPICIYMYTRTQMTPVDTQYSGRVPGMFVYILYMYEFMNLYVYIYACMYDYICIHICVYMHTRMTVYVYTSVYICIHICVRMYMCTQLT